VHVSANNRQLSVCVSKCYHISTDTCCLRPALCAARHCRLGVMQRRAVYQRQRISWNSTRPTRTPTPTSSPTSARGLWRGCRRVRRLPYSACHRNNFVLYEPGTHEDPRRHARFSSRGSSRGCPLGMRPWNVYTYCTR